VAACGCRPGGHRWNPNPKDNNYLGFLAFSALIFAHRAFAVREILARTAADIITMGGTPRPRSGSSAIFGMRRVCPNLGSPSANGRKVHYSICSPVGNAFRPFHLSPLGVAGSTTAVLLRPSRPCLRLSLPWFSVKGLNVSDGVYVFVLAKLAASNERVG
jgi:hypothetical protein